MSLLCPGAAGPRIIRSCVFVLFLLLYEVSFLAFQLFALAFFLHAPVLPRRVGAPYYSPLRVRTVFCYYMRFLSSCVSIISNSILFRDPVLPARRDLVLFVSARSYCLAKKVKGFFFLRFNYFR